MQKQVGVVAERSERGIKCHRRKEHTKVMEGPNGYIEVVMIVGEIIACLKSKLKHKVKI